MGMAHLPVTALVSGTIPEGSHSCFQCQENLHFWSMTVAAIGRFMPNLWPQLQVHCHKVTACSSQTQLDMSRGVLCGCSGHNRDLTWSPNPHLIFSVTIFILYPKTAISSCSALWPQIGFSFSLSEKGQSTKFKVQSSKFKGELEWPISVCLNIRLVLSIWGGLFLASHNPGLSYFQFT